MKKIVYLLNFFVISVVFGTVLNSCAVRRFRGNSSLKNEAIPTSNHNEVFAPSDLSVLFPPAGLPPSMNAGINTRVMNAVLGIESQGYTDLAIPSGPVSNSNASSQLAELTRKGMWPKLMEDSGDGFLSSSDFQSIKMENCLISI